MLDRELSSRSRFAGEFPIHKQYRAGNPIPARTRKDKMGWKNIYLDNHSYFFTSKIVEGISVFEFQRLKEILLDLMNFYREKYRTKIQAYVIMPTHLHLIINSQEGENIKSFMQNLLRKSSIRIIEYLKKKIGTKHRCGEIPANFEDFQRSCKQAFSTCGLERKISWCSYLY
jgi:REP element-mobilizing transposase RayT